MNSNIRYFYRSLDNQYKIYPSKGDIVVFLWKVGILFGIHI